MAYTADINIVVKGQAAVNSLQKSLIEVGEKLDELAKKRIGPAATLETFNKQLREARSRLDEVVAGTSNETAAIKNYVTALGNANAASERQNKLIQEEIDLRQASTVGARELSTVLAGLAEKQRQLENSALDEKAARVQQELDRQAQAAAESAAQIQKLADRQADFTARTDAAAQAASRQTAEFIRQQRIAKELAKINANAPAPQLLLAPAAPGSPAMSGGARSLITGPVERLGGARTQDQADMALRFAQALKEQVRPLTQIQALYAGIASEAAAMQRVKALPDAAMLNAASRGIKSLETGQDRYNRELAESAERLQQLDRLEASRARRAEKLRQIADYYGTPSAMANAGFGVQGPAMPPGGVRRPGAGGGRTGGVGSRLENIALGVGFPLLFGGGAGEVLGSLAGSFVGTGFGGQIFGGAIGGIIDNFVSGAGKIGAALDPVTADFDVLVSAIGGVTTSAGQYITKLEELKMSQEALAVATEELNRLVGVSGTEALKTFGEDSAQLGSVFVQAMTQMQASVASLINSSGILKALTAAIEYNVLLRQGLTSQDPRQQSLVKQREQANRPGFAGGDPQKVFELNSKIVEQQRQINAEKEKEYSTRTKTVTQEEKLLEISKQAKKLAQELKQSYSELTNESRKRIEAEQASVDRGLSVANARYEAEKALVDLDKTRLERAYELAATQQKRLDIAIALFNNTVQTAQIEYQQQLETIAAAELKIQLELRELQVLNSKIIARGKEAELAALMQADEKTRLALLAQIKTTTEEAVAANSQAITEVQAQLESQKLIGEYQKQAAEAQFRNKVLAAETALEQKLVSAEIGLSNTAAQNLAQQLSNNVVITDQLASNMARVAAQAASAAQQMQNALNLQNMLRGGGNQNAGVTAFASGGYVTGPTPALVGEGGSEYIIPAGKMDEAMARYASGRRGSSVIPSSINPQVNVTTGPVMNMNGSNYVSQQDFMAGMQTASRRGAEMALEALQSNGSTRRLAGVG